MTNTNSIKIDTHTASKIAANILTTLRNSGIIKFENPSETVYNNKLDCEKYTEECQKVFDTIYFSLINKE